jgi:hypothetical protein
MPFSNLTPTSTFTQWYEQTNEISTFLNEQIVANGQPAYGDFEFGANATINAFGTILATEDLLDANTNVSIGHASSWIYAYGNTFVVASNNIILNPITSVFVNTAITVNAVATFLANIVAANVSVGALVASSQRTDGNIVANNGTLVARQLSFTTNGAAVNSTLASAGYQDHDFTGLDDASVWYATPTTNTVISGLQGHVAVTASTDGARVLYLLNLSDTKKITLSSANTVSTAQHRFQTVDNVDVDVLPRGSALLVYSKVTERWRVVGGTPASAAAPLGNTTVTGLLTVSGNTTLSANLAVPPLYVNQVTSRVGVGTATPSAKFHSVGPNLLEDVTTAVDLRADVLTITGAASFAAAAAAIASNGQATFAKVVSPLATIGTLTVGGVTSNATVTAATITGTTGTFAGTVSGATGTFTTLGAVNGTTGTFSGAVTVGGKLAPSADATLGFGDATHRWTAPFLSVANGASDATMALVQASTGEVKQITGYTGTKYVQGVVPDGGGWIYTWKAGILVSVTAVP